MHIRFALSINVLKRNSIYTFGRGEDAISFCYYICIQLSVQLYVYIITLKERMFNMFHKIFLLNINELLQLT